MRKFTQLLLFCIVLCIQLSAQVNPFFTLRGKVAYQGEGIKDVIVTDGNTCVSTDKNGEYYLQTTSDARFVYISTPAGYLTERNKTLPVFYKEINPNIQEGYNFELIRNPRNDHKHLFVVQADVQVTSKDDLEEYTKVLNDCRETVKTYSDYDIFGLDCGDIVGDTPSLYPDYIRKANILDFPIYRAIGNHDMDYWGRTHETSYKTFESYFGPTRYSFNKGNIHYIIINNTFFIGRDYFYMGYVDEKTFHWLEQDLSFVPQDHTVILCMHIPLRLQENEEPFSYGYKEIADQTVNGKALIEILKPYQAHIITGHMHHATNLTYSDRLMEHNTPAVCGTWWRADACLDGTPRGYGVYEINNNKVEWYYKSAGYPKDFQFRAYAAASCSDFPSDIIVNVWNWDKNWKVEWLEDGILMGEMIKYSGYDPYAKSFSSNKKQMKYDWISPATTNHLFRATPHNPKANIEIRIIDSFGNVYRQSI